MSVLLFLISWQEILGLEVNLVDQSVHLLQLILHSWLHEAGPDRAAWVVWLQLGYLCLVFIFRRINFPLLRSRVASSFECFRYLVLKVLLLHRDLPLLHNPYVLSFALFKYGHIELLVSD